MGLRSRMNEVLHDREVVVVQEKPWWESKTNWLHVGSLVVFTLESQLHVLQPVLGEDMFAIWLLVVNVLGILLRGVTKSPVSLK